MEPATVVQGVSFRKKPRSGQLRIFEALQTHRNSLNVKFPTAYGKTFACAGIYSLLRHIGRVNRLLMIVPSKAQLDQFCNDGYIEFDDAGVLLQGPPKDRVVDISFYALKAIKKHRANTQELFVITVQALKERRGMDLVKELLATGQWMICVDEYHHYGMSKTWGMTVLSLSRAFLLAMSATPWRPDDDGAFGPPDISMTYEEAKEENSVKPLAGHAYNFRIDVIEGDGREVSYTTDKIAALAGGYDPEKIEKLRIAREMRWSPKYVSPLVSIPIDRMRQQRAVTGFPLQTLVCAMCVSHAEFVCEQLKSLYPELTVDWIGTGDNGRTSEENERVLKEFCPPKNDQGKRPGATIDVLVHVGMAGEGLDSVHVSEIVFLSGASVCNRQLQIIGRAARFLSGVEGNVNFDASSEFATENYVGKEIMKAMDCEPSKDTNDPDEPPDPKPLDEMPDEPAIQIFNLELIGIDSGHPGVQRAAFVAAQLDPSSAGLVRELNKDLSDPRWAPFVELFRNYLTKDANEQNEKSMTAQWRQHVDTSVSNLVGRVIRIIAGNQPVERELAGRIKRKINSRKKQFLGEVQNDIETLRKHYSWCRQLERDLIKAGLPAWLP